MATPAASIVSEFQYDAFVSYTGSENTNRGEAQFDRQVAERLCRALETYRTPRSLVRGAAHSPPVPRRLKKIFRDREELSASSDMEASLVEPLRNSRFLIVVCSPRARRSKWVSQEIATFAQLRGEDHILTLLVEGEPEEAFPSALIRRLPSGEKVLPLGADIRAATKRESFRLLKREKLRLLAPMLGCRFDDLRQREHERFRKRVGTVTASLLSLSLVLASLSMALYWAERKAKNRYELALEAGEKILPLVVDPPDDLSRKKIALTNAISATKALCDDDPRNAECLENLKGLQGALWAVNEILDPSQAATDYEETRGLIVPIASARLRAWSPGPGKMSDGIFPASLDAELTSLRSLLSIWDQPMGEAARAEDAVTYAETASKYVERLDTSTPEGRKEARRVLNKNLALFQQARKWRPLNKPQQELMEAVQAALEKVRDD
jgi:MTH538 TIR-like domain (DUF1863)